MSILSAFIGVSAGGSGLSVTASPASFGGAAYDTLDDRVFGPCKALPAGGSGSYTYLWTLISTNSSAIIAQPGSQSTNITVGALFNDISYSIVRCTVTDTETGATARVDVLLTYRYYGPPD